MDQLSKYNFVIYDQFNWNRKDHFVRFFFDKEIALKYYSFFKDCFPDMSLAFVTKDHFDCVVNRLN